MTQEFVVLVDDDNREIGQALKSEVHTDNTPLHRAFSAFVFNSKGEVLLQQRSHTKKTWPLVWSNSCCGHPMPGEATVDAVRRRLLHELGLTVSQVHEVLPDYRYRAELYGIVEYEMCPVFVAFTGQIPHPNPEEIEAIRWEPWEDFKRDVAHAEPPFSVWCIEETKLLATNPVFAELWTQSVTH